MQSMDYYFLLPLLVSKALSASREMGDGSSCTQHPLMPFSRRSVGARERGGGLVGAGRGVGSAAIPSSPSERSWRGAGGSPGQPELIQPSVFIGE